MAPTRTRIGQREAAARALDALGRTADGGVRAARRLYDRWRGAPAQSRGRLAPPSPAAQERAQGPPAAAAPSPSAAGPSSADAMVAAAADSDVSDVDVRDLRAELARELDRLAGADIAASRGEGDQPDGPDERAAGSPAPDARA